MGNPVEPSQVEVRMLNSWPADGATAGGMRIGRRGRLRLHIAARLLGKRRGSGTNEGAFLIAVLNHIHTLTPVRQQELRGMVDWAENYEEGE